MDIESKKSILSANKRFTLKATALAILSLNAESAMAVSCPSVIANSALAGVICDFDVTTGSSVTVANNGKVGGIALNGPYVPAPPSKIVIDAGGLVSNSLTGAGILVDHSTLTDGLINNGTINMQSTGILINKTNTISGGILNKGSIVSSSLTGIKVATANTINGGISNSGTIFSTTNNGIMIDKSNVINGGISNSGSIKSVGASILINSHNTINNGLTNSGVLESSSRTAIQLLNSNTLHGGISNSGKIFTSGNFVGIDVQGSFSGPGNLIDGSISNSGEIGAGDSGNGITIHQGANTITGDIANNGVIGAGHSGIYMASGSLQGSITNSGIIAAVNSVGINVINASTVLGSITNSGKVTAGSIAIAVSGNSTVAGNILNTGKLTGLQMGLMVATGAAVSGSINNSGTISGANTGIAVFSGASVSNGITNSGVIQGGTKAIYIDGSSNVHDINIVGQHARLIGAVDAVNTNMNITSGAVFTSEGSISVNQLMIDPNAVFNMRHTINAQAVVTNAGTLSVGDTSQTINGASGYEQSVGGVFQLGVNSATSYGRLMVNTSVDLSQSGNINVQVSQNAVLHTGEVLSNVISGNGLIAPENGFSVSDNSVIWKFIARANNNQGVDLTAEIDPASFSACNGLYCQGAANTIIGQVETGNPAFSPYAALTSTSAFRDAVSQSTPELTNENIQVMQLAVRSIMDVVPMWAALHGKSAGDAMVYQPGKLWAKPYGASMIQHTQDSVTGFNASSYGLVIGKDVQLPTNWMLGGAVAVGDNNTYANAPLSQRIYGRAYQGMVYGAKNYPHHIYAAAQGLVGYANNDTRRFMPLYASTAQSSFGSWFTNLRAQLGWSMYALNQNLVLTPAVDASFLYVYQNSYHESGSIMNLAVDSNSNFSLVLGAYGNAAYTLTAINQQHVTLTGYVGVAQSFLNKQTQTTATFTAGGSEFITPGIQFNNAVFRGGVGLIIADPAKPLKVDVNYDLQSGNNAYSGAGSLTVIYKL